MTSSAVGNRLLSPRRTLLGSSGYALENLITDNVADGAMCLVLSEKCLYRLDKFSAEPVAYPVVIATSRGAAAPGRWVVSSLLPGAQLRQGVALFTIDNAGVQANIFGYWPEMIAGEYDGDPAVTITLPLAISGIGHGLAILPDGSMMVSTSEASGDPPGNYFERFWHIPPGLTGNVSVPPVRVVPSGVMFGSQGGRTVALFPDGTLMLSRGGGIFARPTLPEFLGVYDLASTPVWTSSGASGELVGSDCHVDSGASAHLVWHQGGDSFYRHDLDQPPGVITPDKIAKGANIGAVGWGGGIATDAIGGSYIIRSDRSDVIYLSAAQKAALTPVPSNPVPTRVINTAIWNAIDVSHETLWAIALDELGGAYIATYIYTPPAGRARIFYIEPAAMAAGGMQQVSRTTLAPGSTVESVRMGPGYGLFLR